MDSAIKLLYNNFIMGLGNVEGDNRSFRYKVNDQGELVPDGRGFDLDSLPESLRQSLKPTNLSDEEWQVLTRINGVAGALANGFKQYTMDGIKAGRRKPIPPAAEAPGLWERVTFGTVGDQAYRETAGDPDKFADFMVQREWDVNELGIFGQWVKEAGVNKGLILPIISSYLRH